MGNGWIDVRERLPEAGRDVLVADLSGNMRVTCPVIGGGWYLAHPLREWTHWQPLPPPPDAAEVDPERQALYARARAIQPEAAGGAAAAMAAAVKGPGIVPPKVEASAFLAPDLAVPWTPKPTVIAYRLLCPTCQRIMGAVAHVVDRTIPPPPVYPCVCPCGYTGTAQTIRYADEVPPCP